MNYINNYWNMDIKRAFFSKKYIYVVIGITISYLIGAEQSAYGRGDTFQLIQNSFASRLVMLSLAAASYAYSDSLCADRENSYQRLLLIRGNRKLYYISKLVVCYLSTIIAMVIGFLFFCFILIATRSYDISGSAYKTLCQHSFGVFLLRKEFFLYFTIIGLQFSFLAGIMSVVSMTLSLFVNNKMIVLASPLFIYYFGINSLASITVYFPPVAFYMIFNPIYYNVWENEWISFIWALSVSLIILFICCLVVNFSSGKWIKNV